MPDPFEHSKLGIPETPGERQIADLLVLFQGRENPTRLTWLCEVSNRGVREVKKTIEQLRVVHQCPIGASRGRGSGYFWMVDAEDFRIGLASYRAQVLSGWRVLRALDDPARLRELRGQLTLEGE